MKVFKIHFFLFWVLFCGFVACQSSGPDEKTAKSTTTGQTTVGSGNTGTGGSRGGTGTPTSPSPSPSGGTPGVFQPSITGNSSPVAGVVETYTLTILGQPVFPIRIVWASFPTGILFNPNPHDLIQPTNQVTVQAIAPQAGTYDLIGTVMDSSQPSRQSTAQMQINVIASGGAGGITPGPTNVIISGDSGIFVNTTHTYIATLPSHFVAPFTITWSSDDLLVDSQLRTQSNMLSVNIMPAPKSAISLTPFNITLFATVVDSRSQVATGQMTIKVCIISLFGFGTTPGTCN